VSIPMILKWYKPLIHYIIVPCGDRQYFEEAFEKWGHVQIVDENRLVSMDILKKIIQENMTHCEDYEDLRIKWYYQQLLKLAQCLQIGLSEGEYIVIWDADTIPLKKIDFVREDKICLFGSPYEYTKEYFWSILEMTDSYFWPKYSYVTQFACISMHTQGMLERLLCKKAIEGEELSTSVSRMIIQTIAALGVKGSASCFSEYELIGYINEVIYPSRQEKIRFMRWELTQDISNAQIQILRILGFVHYTYESRKDSSCKMSWIGFVRAVYSNMRASMDREVDIC